MQADITAQTCGADELVTKIMFYLERLNTYKVCENWPFLLDKFQETVFHLMTGLNTGQIGKSVSLD